MAGKRKIQDYDRMYAILRHYVDFTINTSHRSVLRVGLENIPKDGAVIFAPNHTNTLMDALVMLNTDSSPKVFVARADIFKNRFLARALTFLKIMPIMRQRDGFKEVKKNQEIIDKAVDVLKDRIPFCIFPEGKHLAKYSSLPLSKGIFRIAMQAHGQMPDVPLYIVPVGLRFGNLFRFRTTIRQQIGRPINVGEYLADNATLMPQEQVNGMKDMLVERLNEVILNIPNNQDYAATLEICNALEPVERARMAEGAGGGKEMHALEVQFQANKRSQSRLEQLRTEDAAKAARLLELGREASVLRVKRGVDMESVSVSADRPLASRMPRLLLALLTLPYGVAASVLALPVLLLCAGVCTLMKDRAFWNSVRLLVNLFIWPVFVLVYAVLAFVLLPWQWAALASVLVMPAPIVAHELCRTLRLAISDIRLMCDKRLCRIYRQIRELAY